jgi:hypothetical protein
VHKGHARTTGWRVRSSRTAMHAGTTLNAQHAVPIGFADCIQEAYVQRLSARTVHLNCLGRQKGPLLKKFLVSLEIL